jgi:hypothetical protein
MDNPTDNAGVAAILKGIRRTVGAAHVQKAPAMADVIHSILAHVPRDTLQGKCDRALLLMGFAGAFRRSELVGIALANLTFNEKGVDVLLKRSKTDQEGKGYSVAILNGKALRSVDRLQEWLEAANITEGPIFRSVGRGDRLRADGLSAQSVALIVKRYAEAAGLDAAKPSGHSLHAGFVTSAAENRASISRIMQVTPHRDQRTVETYVRRADRYSDHAGDGFCDATLTICQRCVRIHLSPSVICSPCFCLPSLPHSASMRSMVSRMRAGELICLHSKRTRQSRSGSCCLLSMRCEIERKCFTL